ncbi:AAA family ATPase [Pseudomonas putida]|uniref:AAA family ATPase n=1 Tax=Pseudomonas TaxID=286 RepID=UPI0018E6B9A2|nr:AAA family ATPase [Pseudomonas putida]MBI6944169.1 AAA family ATPase [Pseudomonas putida]MBI6960335.1 AAA family ATPase [Pseudomonas putida]
MAWIVSAVSQKGGTRKTTLCRALAVAYANAGWDVMACDFDTQQTSFVDWAQDRITNGHTPVIEAKPYTDVAKAISENDDRDLVLLDGLPHGSSLALDIAKASDLVLIPTGPSLDDLKPSVILAHKLVKEGIPQDRIQFVVQGVSHTGAEVPEALDYLAQTGFHTNPNFLRTMPSYSKTRWVGLSVLEVPAPTLREEANKMVAGVIAHLERIHGITN